MAGVTSLNFGVSQGKEWNDDERQLLVKLDLYFSALGEAAKATALPGSRGLSTSCSEMCALLADINRGGPDKLEAELDTLCVQAKQFSDFNRKCGRL